MNKVFRWLKTAGYKTKAVLLCHEAIDSSECIQN